MAQSGPGGPLTDMESPEVSVKSASLMDAFDEGPLSGSILPGATTADLDWDDDEEATSVFDRSTSDLFADIVAKPRVFDAADDTAKRDVGNAAALLASSGRAAAVAVPSAPPVQPTQPMQQAPEPESMPRIPAPAPVPRDISGAAAEATPAADAGQAPHPSWAPSMAPPPQKRRGTSTLILALVAVVALGAAAFLYLRSAAEARVQIVVTHQGKSVDKVEIFVDGQKKCDLSPCWTDLKPGEYRVDVRASGLAGNEVVTIEGGKENKVEITLGVASDTAPPDSATAKPTGPASIKLASNMKDVDITVFVDGKKKGKLPQELKDLKPGKVTLRFEGGDKFGKLEKTVDLKPGEALELTDITLPLLKVKVTFVLQTRGAKVKLVKEADGGKKTESVLAFRGNKAIKDIDTSFKWTVLAELKGYDKFEKVLTFEGKDPEQNFDISMEKEKEQPVATGPGPDTGPGPGPAATDVATGPATLSANSIPPSRVIIDGRPRGTTPVSGVKVTPGSHTVIFKHKKYGTKSRTVTVKAGQKKVVVVKFKKKKKKKKKKKSD
ncbi:MAG: PEGA domain-containing protein [Deltaproteobacteria bacterium]|nr:PEGA domain-containing protein [Deltaproteobacteria bacterium]